MTTSSEMEYNKKYQNKSYALDNNYSQNHTLGNKKLNDFVVYRSPRLSNQQTKETLAVPNNRIFKLFDPPHCETSRAEPHDQSGPEITRSRTDQVSPHRLNNHYNNNSNNVSAMYNNNQIYQYRRANLSLERPTTQYTEPGSTQRYTQKRVTDDPHNGPDQSGKRR